jgi:hypothetical protein
MKAGRLPPGCHRQSTPASRLLPHVDCFRRLADDPGATGRGTSVAWALGVKWCDALCLAGSVRLRGGNPTPTALKGFKSGMGRVDQARCQVAEVLSLTTTGTRCTVAMRPGSFGLNRLAAWMRSRTSNGTSQSISRMEV